MTEPANQPTALVVRHHAIELVEHWAIALSGLILFFSGMFSALRFLAPTIRLSGLSSI